jgi:hypothetical protein
MQAYTSTQLATVPVEVNPLYRLDDGERMALRAEIDALIARAFDLRPEGFVQAASPATVYPTNLEELQKIAQGSDAAGAVGTSVFNLARRPDGTVTALGLRIVFIDAEDRKKTWTLSRVYHGSFELDPPSHDLVDAIGDDLQVLHSNLALGSRTLGRLGDKLASGIRRPRFRSLKDGPELTVATALELSDDPILARDETVETSQSIYSVNIVGADDLGIDTVFVENRRMNFERRFDFLSAGSASAQTTYFEDVVDVPLRTGKNTILVSIQNTRGEVAARRFVARRVDRENVRIVGVALDEYESAIRPDVPFTDDLGRLFVVQQPRPGLEVALLRNEDATRLQVLSSALMLGEQSSRDETGLGVFYFAGRVESYREKLYLVTYDSDPQFIAVTGIDTELLRSLLDQDDVVIMDLCEEDPLKRQTLSAMFPGALLSFYSCGEERTTVVRQIRERMDNGSSFEVALSQIASELNTERK